MGHLGLTHNHDRYHSPTWPTYRDVCPVLGCETWIVFPPAPLHVHEPACVNPDPDLHRSPPPRDQRAFGERITSHPS